MLVAFECWLIKVELILASSHIDMNKNTSDVSEKNNRKIER